jgi:rare lipoprotein A
MRAALALTIVLGLSGCGSKNRVRIQPPAAPLGHQEVGIASWYGHPYHGRAAANGEIYDMEKLTAAHRTLAFGTRLRVENLTNSRDVEVRITDRGPFVKNRILDLSRAAAREIRMIGPGTAKVRLTVIAQPSVAGTFAVQAGAYGERANAERALESLKRRYEFVALTPRPGNPTIWRVLVGAESTPEAAAELAARVRREAGQDGAFVVRLDHPLPVYTKLDD